MVEQEIEEVVHIRPACAECTHRCNVLHRNKDLEEEKFDPDRSWPHFGKKVTKLALHNSPQAALCIPATFSDDYPNSVPKDKPITLQGPSGNQWTVGVTERSVLYPGWRAFAHDHRLREGDQLHFRLTKPLHFIVDIFNAHGEVRRSARKARVTGKYRDSSAPPLLDHSRKRKVDKAGLAGIGKNIASGIVDRWGTPAKRGASFREPAATLRFSEETKQWENHEAQGGKEGQVVTIDLVSDDEKPPAISSKLEMLIGHNKGEVDDEDFITMQSKAFATQAVEDKKVANARSHQEITSDGDDDYVDKENEPFDEEEEQRPSDDPLRQFSNIFNTTRKRKHEDLHETAKGTAEKAVVKSHRKKEFEAASDPLGRRAETLCGENMVTVKEEEDEHEHEHSELDKATPQLQACVIAERKLETVVPDQDTTPKEEEKTDAEMETDKVTKTTIFLRKEQNSGIRHNHKTAEVQQSYKTPLTHEDTAGDYEPAPAQKAVDSSPMTILQTIKAMSAMYESTENSKPEDDNSERNQSPRPDQMQEAEGAFSFGLSPDSDVEYPVITGTMNGDQTDGMETLKKGLQQAGDEETLTEMEGDEDLTERKEIVFEAHELPVTKAETRMEKEENPNMPVSRENEEEKITVLGPSISNPDFKTPEKVKDNNIQARVAETINTCVLGSKRWQVFQFDRERALKAAQAWARKIRNPNFMTVMKNSHVYTDFVLDVPTKFAKQSKLPSHDVRVTLVCDEVPRNCKAQWLASQSQLDCKGWGNFSRNHYLEEGDVCVFEGFPAGSVRFGVYIFRLVKLRRPIVLDWTRHYKVLQGDDGIAAAPTDPAASPPPLPCHAAGAANPAYEANSNEESPVGFGNL